MCNSQVKAHRDIVWQSEVELDLDETYGVRRQGKCSVFCNGRYSFIAVLIPIDKISTSPYFIGGGLKTARVVCKGKDHSCLSNVSFDMFRGQERSRNIREWV